MEQFPEFPLELNEQYETEEHPTIERPLMMENTTNMKSEDKAANDTELSIEDFAISVLFKFKYYPFRKKVARGGRLFAGSEHPNGMIRRATGNRGVMATGIDFGLPGGLGFGYGEQIPFRTFLSYRRISLPQDNE